jgi:hypothetical protein
VARDAGLPPYWQRPAAQVCVDVHTEHTTAATPQWAAFEVTQAPLRQHPEAQFCAVQVVDTHLRAVHTSVVRQATQSAPPEPHASCWVPAAQVPTASKQPAQAVGTQVAFSQRRPASQV